jgi:hypothetical protein
MCVGSRPKARFLVASQAMTSSGWLAPNDVTGEARKGCTCAITGKCAFAGKDVITRKDARATNTQSATRPLTEGRH